MAQIRNFTSTNESYFVLDGVSYPKVYEAMLDNGYTKDRVKLVGTNRDNSPLVFSTHYSNIRVDGASFASANEAISRLNQVVFSKGGGSGGGGTVEHNELEGLQGGQPGQYYHLTQEEYENLGGGSGFMTLNSENEVTEDWGVTINNKKLYIDDFGNKLVFDSGGYVANISSEFVIQEDGIGNIISLSRGGIQGFLSGFWSLTKPVGVTQSSFLNFPITGDTIYFIPISVNGQFADEYGNIEIEGGTGGDYIPLSGTEEGKPVTGDIEIEAPGWDIWAKIGMGYGVSDDFGYWIKSEPDKESLNLTGFSSSGSNGMRFYDKGQSIGSLAKTGFGFTVISEEGVDENVSLAMDGSGCYFVPPLTIVPEFYGLHSLSYYPKNSPNCYAQIEDVNKANSYSTTETKTGGTWIDGKPIYTITKLTADPVPADIETQFPNIIVGSYTIYKYTKTTD